MPRCELTGKKPVVKNLVSHSNIKTKSRAFPNVWTKTFYSSCLKRSFRLKVAASTIRSIDKSGGIDHFLIKCPLNQLSPFALKLRKNMEKRLHKKDPKKK
ncbi:MAG: 50S ribosomal protein L28 [Bdellovibrionales bacterium]|nr:50S ribosomal protein L28 [Bdellovibrionales bacterium]